MEIYFHNQNIKNIYTPETKGEVKFRGNESVLLRRAGESADKFVRRPVAEKSATGLHGFKKRTANIFGAIGQYAHNYVHNIKHTVEHKIVVAKIADRTSGKQYKKNLAQEVTIENLMKFLKYKKDIVTHDLDKLVLYVFGFPREFVSKVHRKHSQHHWESGMVPNLDTMLWDNMASNPIFKPEKKLSLRDYYSSSPELQGIEGLGELFEKYDYGEHIDIKKPKQEPAQSSQYPSVRSMLAKAASLIIASV